MVINLVNTEDGLVAVFHFQAKMPVFTSQSAQEHYHVKV